MSKRMMCGLAVLGAAWLALAGCAGPLACEYEPGQVQRVRLETQQDLWTWVEMPGDEPTQRNGEHMEQEIVVRREVESVDEEGVALMNVTVEEARVDMRRVLNEKETLYDFESTAQATRSSSGETVKLAGASYRIRIRPDTTVEEIMGLEEMFTALGVPADERERGVVGMLLTEEAIRNLHERPFVQSGVKPGGTEKELRPLPHFMIKAQAVQATVDASGVEQQDGREVVEVDTTGVVWHQLPEGWDDAPQPPDPGRRMIKEMSDMQAFELAGRGEFDVAAGRVLRDEETLNAQLALFEEKVFQGPRQKQPDEWGVMFTEVDTRETYELLE